MQSVPPTTTASPGEGSPITCTMEVDALLELASAGDVRAVARQMQARAQVDGSVTPTLEHWVVPALREVGLRWQRHEYSVADDHVITNTLSEALGVARAAMPPGEVHGTAAAVTLGSDQHEICSRLTQVCLDGAGFSCVLLGRGLPIGDLVRWVNETSPDVLACSVPITLDPARANAELIALCASLGPRTTIYVGGAGAALLDFVPPGVCYLRSLHELEAAIIARRQHRA
jgi:MerR family transcriptional regulator, light-induced transcriptional regulator